MDPQVFFIGIGIVKEKNGIKTSVLANINVVSFEFFKITPTVCCRCPSG